MCIFLQEPVRYWNHVSEHTSHVSPHVLASGPRWLRPESDRHERGPGNHGCHDWRRRGSVAGASSLRSVCGAIATYSTAKPSASKMHTDICYNIHLWVRFFSHSHVLLAKATGRRFSSWTYLAGSFQPCWRFLSFITVFESKRFSHFVSRSYTSLFLKRRFLKSNICFILVLLITGHDQLRSFRTLSFEDVLFWDYFEKCDVTFEMRN